MAAIFVRPMRRWPARAAAAGQRRITLQKVEASFFICVPSSPHGQLRSRTPFLASLRDGTSTRAARILLKPPSCYTRQRKWSHCGGSLAGEERKQENGGPFA